MSRLAVLLLICGLLVAAGPARADESRIPVVTRLVHLFGELEGKVTDAAAHGDRATLEQLVADDFELRAGAQPGVPVPRADWIAATLADPAPGAVSQMAAIDHGEFVAVSFLWRRAGGKSSDPGRFTVDLWRKDGDTWRLATRYAAVGRGGVPRHAAAPASTILKKKY